MPRNDTPHRILHAATDLFGRRGVEAVSLDVIAADVGVAKQTLLYWFPSKDELVAAVLADVADQLSLVVGAAVRAAPDDPLERIDAVVRAVFRPAVRRPALLGLVREVSRLKPEVAERLAAELVGSPPGFLVLEKRGPTPAGFPRRPGVARKRPLA